MEYQEVIACADKPLFNQKIFLKRALDPITICLIEQCFKVKILKTKIQEKNWLRASNVKFSPVKINKFIVTSSFFANSGRQDRY